MCTWQWILAIRYGYLTMNIHYSLLNCKWRDNQWITYTWDLGAFYITLQLSLYVPVLYFVPLQKACFQLVLASDYRTYRSYSIFNYNRMGWKVQTKRPQSQGFQSEPYDLFESKQLSNGFYTSGSSLAYQLPNTKGPLGSWLLDCICFIHSLVHSLIQTFTKSVIRSFIQSVIQPVMYLLIN